jgi:expansin (peptidoglycan-binding protein)
MWVALSTNLYDSPTPSGACGKCVQITGTTGMTATYRVVDQCPSASNVMQCSTNHVDINQQKYSIVEPGNSPGAIANSPGVAVKFVPCNVTGNIIYDFATSNSYYLAMVIENARYGIKSVQYRATGSCNWSPMTAPTDPDPHWKVATSPPNPIDIQVTDEWGQMLEDTGVHWSASQVTGSGQFPQCN